MLLNAVYILIIAFAVCLALVIAESIRENKLLEVRKYTISSDKLKNDLRIVMLGDLHNATFGHANEALIAKIAEQKPDAIMIPGDLIVGHAGENVDVAIHLLESLSKIAPTYVSKGNHELRTSIYLDTYGDMWQKLYDSTKGVVTWLINDAAIIPDADVTVVGLDMDRYYYKRFVRPKMESAYLDETLPAVDESTFKILLAHNPDFFPEYAAWGADLTFSGHVHGGMMILPVLGGVVSPMIRLFPKYYRGLYTEGKSNMILTAGLGGHTFKIRVNNKPELVVVHLTNENAKG